MEPRLDSRTQDRSSSASPEEFAGNLPPVDASLSNRRTSDIDKVLHALEIPPPSESSGRLRGKRRGMDDIWNKLDF
ncbi:MAG TPA: hypothetical protein V6C88_20585 [Chroococcidiopsis sp.]